MRAAPSWVTGDHYKLLMPAHPTALREGGAEFLTQAFRMAGGLSADNRVSRISGFEDCSGGSTGRKILLSVEYQQPEPDLLRDLFVKFSRDFDNPARDLGRSQMELECRFAQLSRHPSFPITVPACLFADFHAATGTGLLITARIPYGRGGIEPQHGKCMDDELPEPLAHYEAIVRALARLAGTHRAGRFPPSLIAQFPNQPETLSVGARAPYSAAQLQKRVSRYAEFAACHPALLPENIRDPVFIARLMEQVTQLPAMQAAIQHELACRPDYIALCHWNANVDNAWFWRGAAGRIECGLLDWGCASQMNVAMALWGALSGAETDLWNRRLDTLLDLFVAEFAACGGPMLDVAILRRNLLLYATQMGLNWLLDVPALFRKQLPDLGPEATRHDPRIRHAEALRAPLQMLVNLLNLMSRTDVFAGFQATSSR